MKLLVFLIALGVVVVSHTSKIRNFPKRKNAVNVTHYFKDDAESNEPETAKGLMYLGVGYNILEGNPEGGDMSTGGVDPGLRSTRHIFQLTWDDGKTTSDLKYNVPDQVEFAHHSSCVEKCKHEMYSGTKSYQTKLMDDVQVSAGYEDPGEDALMKSAFSLSNKFQQADSDTRKDKRVVFEKKKVCNKGRARYITLAGVTKSLVSKEFAMAVCNLPTKYDKNKNAYFKFVDQWGTHIVTEVELGTKWTESFSSSYHDIASYASENLADTLTVSNGYMGLSGALSAAFEKFKEKNTDTSKFIESKDIIISGGPDLPAPIGLKLLPIGEALSNSYFKHLNQKFRCKGMTTRKENLKRFLTEYSAIKHTTEPSDPEVRIPVSWPTGTYGLPMAKSGCPSGGFWREGTAYHETEGSNTWSNPYDLAGYKAGNGMEQKYCMKTTSSEYSLPWPKGQYCIYKKGRECPDGLEKAMIFWMDEWIDNHNWIRGEVPEGDYRPGFIRNRFCCRTDGLTANEIILPTDSPFVLMQSEGAHRQCQEVKGMQVREEWFKWDCDDWTAGVLGSMIGETREGPIGAGVDGAGNVKVPYCYYYKAN